MTTITCDLCAGDTQTDVAVYRRVPHYSAPHWVVLVRMCNHCATRRGWRQKCSPSLVNPYFSNARQFEAWLRSQLTAH